MTPGPETTQVDEPAFDCTNCIGICCSVYETIEVYDHDIDRLAGYFNTTPRQIVRRYTYMKDGQRSLKKKPDPLLNQTCIFFDLEKRLCGIYEGRPDVCRAWPLGTERCVYYDLLQYERRIQCTHDVVPLIQLTVYPAESEG